MSNYTTLPAQPLAPLAQPIHPPLLAPFSLPIHMLPPLLRDTVNEAQTNIQAPVPLIFAGALTSIAVAIQGLINVCKPNGQQVPGSLMLLSIANSGERKSTAENIFLGPIRQFQNQEKKLYQQQLGEWKIKDEAWQGGRKAILKAISKKATQNKSFEEEERQLLEHEAKKPAKPRLFKLLYEDATAEVLFAGLHQHSPSAGLISSEGSGVLNGPALNDLAKQNAIWSGDTITVDRVTAESYELVDARLTTSVMVQDSAFQGYMKRHGEKSRGSGLWARFLVCQPLSTQGTRFLLHTTCSWIYREQFGQRITDLLTQNLIHLNDPNQSKHVLHFAPDACARWLEIFNAIEGECQFGGRFAQARDHASKLADNMVRIAALLHFFEGAEGDIPLKTLETAIQIGLWYSAEFMRIFVPPPPIPQEQLDAIELGSWLQNLQTTGFGCIRKNFVRQNCPNKLREKNRLNQALNTLAARGSISFFTDGKTTYINLMFPMPQQNSPAFQARPFVR